jgi:hypothetical protein
MERRKCSAEGQNRNFKGYGPSFNGEYVMNNGGRRSLWNTARFEGFYQTATLTRARIDIWLSQHWPFNLTELEFDGKGQPGEDLYGLWKRKAPGLSFVNQ